MSAAKVNDRFNAERGVISPDWGMKTLLITQKLRLPEFLEFLYNTESSALATLTGSITETHLLMPCVSLGKDE